MDDGPCMNKVLDLEDAIKKLNEATERVKHLETLERIKWQEERAEAKRQMVSAQKKLKIASDELQKCKEENDIL